MSIYVVDASVAAKWFFDEPLSDEATGLLDASYALHVPDFFLLEIDSLLCKKMRRGEISEGESQEIRSAIHTFPLHKHPFRKRPVNPIFSE
jgi:predicted nucleic acid-binding protein